jgi:GNAT superfamily N-acetyltransferase
MHEQEQLAIRPATPSDAGIIAEHRAAMFRDMGQLPSDADYARLREASEAWLTGLFISDQYIGWLVEDDLRIVAGGGILIREQLPVPGCCKIGPCAHIMNVYTSPAYRRRGLARRLLILMLQWCVMQKMNQVTLTASNDGRSLYESLGFQPTSDMRLVLVGDTDRTQPIGVE